jgi:thymidylate synthase
MVEEAYLDLLEEILQEGDYRKGRNGGTSSLFGKTLTFNLKDEFPLLTTKKVFFRGVVEELLFFLRGETNTKILENNKINIWKGNTSKEFLESRNLTYQEGDMGPMYGFNWLHFGAQYHGCHGDYTGEGMNQLEKVIRLLKEDPFSRRIMMTTYNPLCAEEGVLYPCHGIITQFYIREYEGIKYVSCCTYLRSNDMFLGSPFNIASYALLTYLICKKLGSDYQPDKLVMQIGDAHIYESHFEQCKEQISRREKIFPFPQITIDDFDDWTDLTFKNFHLINYQSHSAIHAEMVA